MGAASARWFGARIGALVRRTHRRRRHQAGTSRMVSLQDLVFEAIASGDAAKAEAACRAQRDAIAAAFPSWCQVPDELRSDPEALRRYASCRARQPAARCDARAGRQRRRAAAADHARLPRRVRVHADP
jgi:hypothetical protein